MTKHYKIQVLRPDGTEKTSLLVRTWGEVIANKKYWQETYELNTVTPYKVRVIRFN